MAGIKASFVGFDYLGEGEAKEIMRNVNALLATPAGTCAGDRGYGIDWGVVDMARPDAENQLMLEATEKLEEYEPRVQADSIAFSLGADGQLIAYLTLTPRDMELDLEEADEA